MKVLGWLATTLRWTVLPGLPTGGDLTVGRGKTLERHSEWESPLSKTDATAAVTSCLTDLDGDVVDAPNNVTALIGSRTRARFVGGGPDDRNFPVTVSVALTPGPSGTTLVARISSTPGRGSLLSLDDVHDDILYERHATIVNALKTATTAS